MNTLKIPIYSPGNKIQPKPPQNQLFKYILHHISLVFMKFHNLKIGLRIRVFMFLLLSMFFILLGISIYLYQHKTILKQTDEQMNIFLDDLHIMLSNHVSDRQEIVNVSMNLASQILENKGKIEIQNKVLTTTGTNQLSKQKKEYQIDSWTINGNKIFKDTSIVDEIKSRSVETVTIFQKIEDGYLRVSTNVMTKDNKRAIGTFIPNSSPVIKTIEKGEIFYGRAFVVNDWYLSTYKPLWVNGKIQGILYVGVKELNYKLLKEVFSNQKYQVNGYPFLINSTGKMTIHPTQENHNFSKSEFFNEILNSTGKNNFRYKWPENENGKWKQQYFKYFEPYDSYICVSVYEKDMYASLKSLLSMILIGVLICLTASYICLTLLTRPVISGINTIAEFSNQIAKGNLTSSIDITGTDELGKTAKSLKSMQGQLKDIIGQIIVGSNSLTKASDQISISSEELSQSANEQATTIEEVSSTVEEMVNQINQNATFAQKTGKIASDAKLGIEELNKKSDEALKANQLINKKIGFINSLAFQTNILSLNASVEAARAGKMGGGFAVVASEVRQLSENSKEAAKQINNIVKDSILTSEQAKLQMDNVLPQLLKTNKLVQGIVSANKEQLEGAELINSAIHQLNNASQINASSSEELAANAEEMSQLAENFNDIVQYFRTN